MPAKKATTTFQTTIDELANRRRLKSMKLKDTASDPSLKFERWRETLDSALAARAKAVWETIGEQFIGPLDAWIDNFCYDCHPDREIAIWEWYSAIFKKHTAGRPYYYRSVVWRAIQMDLRETPVQVLTTEEKATYVKTPTPVLCPFIGSGKHNVWVAVLKDLQKRHN